MTSPSAHLKIFMQIPLNIQSFYPNKIKIKINLNDDVHGNENRVNKRAKNE